MKPLLLKFWIFGLAFGLGISVSTLWRIYTLPELPQPGPPAVLVSPAHPTLTVNGEMHACGPTVSAHTYELTGGIRISTRCENYSSLADASRVLESRLHGVKIAERLVNIEGNGRLLGETVLITDPTTLRLSTHGKTLCAVTAPSLQDLQAFELEQHKYRF